jgi:hypothetical protein
MEKKSAALNSPIPLPLPPRLKPLQPPKNPKPSWKEQKRSDARTPKPPVRLPSLSLSFREVKTKVRNGDWESEVQSEEEDSSFGYGVGRRGVEGTSGGVGEGVGGC